MVRRVQNGGGSSAARESRGAREPAGSKNDAGDRPGASGHRFGPELACSECGILWDVHQREPKPCRTEPVPDAFARRPSGDSSDKSSGNSSDKSSDKSSDDAAAAPNRDPADDESDAD